MKIVLLTRYHRVDNTCWRKELVSELNKNNEVYVIFASKSIISHFQDGLKRFGWKTIIKTVTKKIIPMKKKGNSTNNKLLYKFCQEIGVKTYLTNRTNDFETESLLKEINPDIIIISNSGIIRKNILEIPKIGTLNAHYAILPDIRGMNAIEWSIFLKKKTGVTIHFVDEKIDTGDILLKEEINYKYFNNLEELRKEHQLIAKKLLLQSIEIIKQDIFNKEKQKKEDGKQYFKMHPYFLDKINSVLNGNILK